MMLMGDSGLHRVRRLRWQARAPSATDAFALQKLLHRHSDDVGAALEQALASIGLGEEIWHLPSLTLRLDACSLAQMDAALPALVTSALRQALQAALPADATPCAGGTSRMDPVADLPQVSASRRSTAAESAHAALRRYLATGNLPWALAGLSAQAQQQALQGAAQAALEALLVQQDQPAALLEWLGAALSLPARLGALLRWLPLLSRAQRHRWLAHSPRPAGLTPALADAWFALLASPGIPLEWVALWGVWPTLKGLRAPVRTASTANTANTATSSSDAHALARWIADLPTDIAALRLPPTSASDAHLAVALRQALGDSLAPDSTASAPPVRQTLDLTLPMAPAFDTQLVPLAGLVLLHPYLPRLLKGCGLVDAARNAAAIHIADSALPRACAVLHALACGDGEATEHQLPLIKLLLGRAPDDPLTAAVPRPTATDREEIEGLLVAVRSHWKALGNTSVEGLRLSFLQRRGLLRQADGAWQMHLQAEAFDMLLDLLPWSISLVKLPWMALPLMVEWRAP